MKLSHEYFNVDKLQNVIRNYKSKKGITPTFIFPTAKEILNFASTKDVESILNELVDVQSSHGNYDFDPYMFGLANGLILAKSTMMNIKPKFLKPPDRWLIDSSEAPLLLETLENYVIDPETTIPKGKTILITGGAGFIGSHLATRLSKDNNVIIVDNFFTGCRENIKHLNVEFIRHDIVKEIHLEVDEIYHLACPASPVHYQSNPIKTIKTNILGTMNMLGLAKRTKARIVLASTSEIYGDPLKHPQTEDYFGNVNPIGLRSCYTNDTEVLTENGWKFFPNLQFGEKIATLNNDTKQLEYYVPDEIIKENYCGDVYEFKNWHMDLSVTPNHKMLIKQRRHNDYILKEASLFKDYRHTHMLKQCNWEGEEKEYFYFTEHVENYKKPLINRVKMDDWLEFMGYYLTEGCVYFQKKKVKIKNKIYETINYRIQISQHETINPIIFEKIKKCLNRLGIKHYISRNNNCYFVFQNKQIAIYLDQFGKSGDKFIPQEFLMLSKRQLFILYKAMIDGDAKKKYDKYVSNVYYSKSEKMIGNFQELLIKIGYFGNIKQPPKGRVVRSITCIESYKTHQYPNPTIRFYNGNVYCVNVKNHIILVRRNGKAVFCGNCYDEGKRVSETLCFNYQREHGVNIGVARIFNTYGPQMALNDGRVISNFIVQSLKKENITIYGDGMQTRSFCYVDDMVDGLIRLMASNLTGPINLGNPNERTVLDTALDILEKTNNDISQIEFRDLPSDDPIKRKPDITLAKKYLKWEPRVKLEDGLDKTIEYFSKKLNA
jgi:UDP-glucuronate decarboxylase